VSENRGQSAGVTVIHAYQPDGYTKEFPSRNSGKSETESRDTVRPLESHRYFSFRGQHPWKWCMPSACYLSQEKEFLLHTAQDHHLQMCFTRTSVSNLHHVKWGVPIKEVNTGYVNDTVLKCVLLGENIPSCMWQSANIFPKGHHLNMNLPYRLFQKKLYSKIC
jgi:hypothetical protein